LDEEKDAGNQQRMVTDEPVRNGGYIRQEMRLAEAVLFDVGLQHLSRRESPRQSQ